MNTLVNFLIGLIILILIGAGIFIGKIYLDNNEEQTTPTKKESQSEERMKKINDSFEQRDERIKALKEVGKRLGG